MSCRKRTHAYKCSRIPLQYVRHDLQYSNDHNETLATIFNQLLNALINAINSGEHKVEALSLAVSQYSCCSSNDLIFATVVILIQVLTMHESLNLTLPGKGRCCHYIMPSMRTQLQQTLNLIHCPAGLVQK